MSKGNFFDKSKYLFYRFLIFSFLEKLLRSFHTFGKFCISLYKHKVPVKIQIAN